MPEKKQEEVPIIDFDNPPKDLMKRTYFHVGGTIYDEKGKEFLHLCKRISIAEEKE